MWKTLSTQLHLAENIIKVVTYSVIPDPYVARNIYIYALVLLEWGFCH